ncbi:hypothetical protein KPH14_004666 [Odynerus spinipes]|uniref:Uncharacterized protein n=1 Tax=Odynerus spinipes TaxID=1348599 RepID=A0AAD9RM76_9HYME|nr:hypothetical protein KPH14_004666 [Odynerus spinipes]
MFADSDENGVDFGDIVDHNGSSEILKDRSGSGPRLEPRKVNLNKRGQSGERPESRGSSRKCAAHANALESRQYEAARYRLPG